MKKRKKKTKKKNSFFNNDDSPTLVRPPHPHPSPLPPSTHTHFPLTHLIRQKKRKNPINFLKNRDQAHTTEFSLPPVALDPLPPTLKTLNPQRTLSPEAFFWTLSGLYSPRVCVFKREREGSRARGAGREGESTKKAISLAVLLFLLIYSHPYSSPF